MPTETHYATLGIAPDAEDVVIRAAYKAMMMKYHPDTTTDEKAHAEEMAKAINRAYDVLSDPEKRAEYDASLAGNARPDPDPLHEPAQNPAPDASESRPLTRAPAEENRLSLVALVMAIVAAIAWLSASNMHGRSGTEEMATDASSTAQTAVPAATDPSAVGSEVPSPSAVAEPVDEITSKMTAYSSEYNECLSTGDAANGVTVAILDCNGAEIDRQDDRLNQAYAAAMAKLSSAEKARLRTSERSWIEDRDANCRREAGAGDGGTLASVSFSGCVLNETAKRADWLEQYQP